MTWRTLEAATPVAVSADACEPVGRGPTAINLNQRETFTRESVAELLASKDDSQDREIRVMENGDVLLSDVVGNQGLAGVQFRMETLSAHNGYVGEAASEDEGWVRRLYHSISEGWYRALRGCIDNP